MLLIIDTKLEGLIRERMLVAFHRYRFSLSSSLCPPLPLSPLLSLSLPLSSALYKYYKRILYLIDE